MQIRGWLSSARHKTVKLLIEKHLNVLRQQQCDILLKAICIKIALPIITLMLKVCTIETSEGLPQNKLPLTFHV